MEKTVYLDCTVGVGQFKHEKAVAFHTADGEAIVGLFPESRIKHNRLEVVVYKEKSNKALVGVEGGDCGGYGFLQGSRFWVLKKDLRVDY